MNELAVETEARRSAVADSPAQALAAVVENATALARAELRLAAAETRAWVTRAAVGVTLLWFSLLLAQVFVLMLALSPLAAGDYPLPRVLAMLGLPLLPALVVFAYAMRELRRLKDPGHAQLNPDPSSRQ